MKEIFFLIKEIFVNSKKFPLMQRNRFVYIKENFFESKKLSSIQRNFSFGRISEKCFFDLKKLFSGCTQKNLLVNLTNCQLQGGQSNICNLNQL